jgi:hypothetical protein
MEREPTEGQGSLPGVPRPRGRPRGAEQPFPIVEAFGYAWDAVSPERDAAFREKWCRFMGADCEKYRQYRLGSCSVTYAARDDDRVRYTYAVCDHRLDGEPVQHAIRDRYRVRGCGQLRQHPASSHGPGGTVRCGHRPRRDRHLGIARRCIARCGRRSSRPARRRALGGWCETARAGSGMWSGRACCLLHGRSPVLAGRMGAGSTGRRAARLRAVAGPVMPRPSRPRGSSAGPARPAEPG